MHQGHLLLQICVPIYRPVYLCARGSGVVMASVVSIIMMHTVPCLVEQTRPEKAQGMLEDYMSG